MILQAIPGLDRARMMRPAYAIEYDAIQPTQLRASLESRQIGNLFFAGQVNGTSGYEEAAGQGLMAGINAVLKARGEAPFVLDREEAYIGVMVDDIVQQRRRRALPPVHGAGRIPPAAAGRQRLRAPGRARPAAGPGLRGRTTTGKCASWRGAGA